VCALSVLLIGGTVFAAGGKEKGEGDVKPAIIRFMWWGSDSRHKVQLESIERYMDLHPNVIIEPEYQGYDGYLQKLMTQIAGRTEPDIMTIDNTWLPDLGAQGDVFVDLTTQKSIDLSPYAKSILDDYCRINGRIIGLPMGSNGFGLMTSTDFLTKYGIPPDIEWTWEKMMEEGERIHKMDPNVYLTALDSGSLFSFIVSPYLYSKLGYYWVDEKTNTITYTKKELADGFSFLYELHSKGVIQPIGEVNLFLGQSYQNPKLANGQLGCVFSWSAIEPFREIWKEKMTVLKPPYTTNGKSKSIAYKIAMLLSISSRSSNIEVAAEFANWLLDDPDAVKILGTTRSVPANTRALEVLTDSGAIDPEVSKMVAFTAADARPMTPLVESNSEIGDILRDICERVIFDRLSPEAAADKFLADIKIKITSIKK
jgi:oligogalacturonide transport system substrate-binding protein